MKVNEAAARGIGVSKAEKTPELESLGRGTGASAAGSGSSTDDRVELSKLSEQVQASDENSPKRQARLEELRLAVASDKYQVDEQAVSHAIIADAMREDPKE